MMREENRPEIGTKMYSVHEHLYHIAGRAGPVKEYCVCEAKVRGYFKGGFTEICLIGKLPGRGMVPYQYPLKDVGTKLFYTPREAALLAKTMTEKYERIWGCIGDSHLRRTWIHLLEEDMSCVKEQVAMALEQISDVRAVSVTGTSPEQLKIGGNL